MSHDKIHVCITSVLFDGKPEGICTGRLVRALLDAGHRVTLITSAKSSSDFSHPNLKKLVLGYRLREPRSIFKMMASLQSWPYSNFYLWTRRAAKVDFYGDMPDLFYGRAWPHASLIPAYVLAKRFDKPLMLHFSDPFPAPNENIVNDDQFFQELQMMVGRADALTFTNKETIGYQRDHLCFDIKRAHVLNHIAPNPVSFGSPGEKGSFYHVGGVGPSRSPVPLLEGFKKHLNHYPDSRLFFVGAHEKYVIPEIERLALGERVEVLPFTNDIVSMFKKAGVLVSIDTWVEPALFTPTKIVEYLVMDRPVLSLTPPGSPVSQLLARSPETTVAVNDYSAKSVAEGLAKAREMGYEKAKFDERLKMMADFLPEQIVKQFEAIMASVVDGDQG